MILEKEWSWLRYSSLQIWHDQGTYSLATLHRCLFLSIINDATTAFGKVLVEQAVVFYYNPQKSEWHDDQKRLVNGKAY